MWSNVMVEPQKKPRNQRKKYRPSSNQSQTSNAELQGTAWSWLSYNQVYHTFRDLINPWYFGQWSGRVFSRNLALLRFCYAGWIQHSLVYATRPWRTDTPGKLVGKNTSPIFVNWLKSVLSRPPRSTFFQNWSIIFPSWKLFSGSHLRWLVRVVTVSLND